MDYVIYWGSAIVIAAIAAVGLTLLTSRLEGGVIGLVGVVIGAFVLMPYLVPAWSGAATVSVERSAHATTITWTADSFPVRAPTSWLVEVGTQRCAVSGSASSMRCSFTDIQGSPRYRILGYAQGRVVSRVTGQVPALAVRR